MPASPKPPPAGVGNDALRSGLDDRLRDRIRLIADRNTPKDGTFVIIRPEPGPLGPVGPLRLKPGDLGPERTIPVKELTPILRSAIAADKRREVWVHAGNEALVMLDSVRATLDDGLIIVGITLQTDQTGPQELTTVFAVGSKDQPAGLLAAVEERPRGEADLAATFADAVIATTWRALLLVVTTLAASAGMDSRGEPLMPAALVATPEQLVVVTQADHRLGQG